MSGEFANNLGNKTRLVAKSVSITPFIILDNGHGGIINGEYQTEGKRSPVWPDGRQLFEGEFNRSIVRRLEKHLHSVGISYLNLVDTEKDVPLSVRTQKANDYYKIHKNCILISIHANSGGGTGFEVFTSPGETSSDKIAEIIIKKYGEMMPELKLRAEIKDGDHDKEANFWMLTQTKMPAILIECAFMDNLKPDCELLLSESGRDRIAKAIFEGIKEVVFENQKN